MATTDLEPVSGEIELRSPYLPLAPAEAKQAMLAYQELCAAVLTPADWIGTPGAPDSFVKRSGWDTLANFYGVSVELVGDTRLERDADGNLTRASARARAIGRDGRVREAGGACGKNEPRFANARGRQKIEHDLPATAETRAVNRAIASLVGFGAVSAEEVDADVRAGGEPELPPWAADIPNDAIDRVSNYLESLVRKLGAEQPERTALQIGSTIHNHCGGRFPDACARLVRLLEQTIPQQAPPEFDGTDEADVSAVADTATAPESTDGEAGT